MLKKKEAYIRLIVIAAILVCVNVIGVLLYKRIDLTQEKRYTLSASTKATLKNLEAPVSFTLYFSSGLPPALEAWKQHIRNEIKEFAANSKVPVAYTIVDPASDPENEIKAQREGLQPQQINVTQGDQAISKRVYLGAEIRYKDKSDVISILQPGSNAEYQFAQSLKQLTSGKIFRLGFVYGHGEPTYGKIKEAWDAAARQYTVDSVNLGSNANLLAYKTLAIVEPLDSFSANDLGRLADYAMNGGNLLIATSAAQASMQQGSAVPKNTNFIPWLQRVGVNIQSDLVIDAQCSQFTVPQKSGMMQYMMKIKFPYAPMVTSFRVHATTQGIQSLVVPFSSAVSVSKGNAFQSQDILVTTSDLSNAVSLPTPLSLGAQWKESDFAKKNIPLAWALSTKNSRWVVIGNGVFMESSRKDAPLPGQNLNFFLNVIDWLNDDTQLITLRNKGVADRPLTSITDTAREELKYMNMFAPIIAIGIIGLLRMFWQKQRQKKWRAGKV
jgi:gliding-associated putative ABC transporter substrate-binding component GldG